MAEPPGQVPYIAGVSHCGSTFLEALLGQVEGVFFAGELPLRLRYRYRRTRVPS